VKALVNQAENSSKPVTITIYVNLNTANSVADLKKEIQSNYNKHKGRYG